MIHTTHCDQTCKYITIHFLKIGSKSGSDSAISYNRLDIFYTFFPAFFFHLNEKEQNLTYKQFITIFVCLFVVLCFFFFLMALRRKHFYSVYPTDNNIVGKALDAKYLISRYKHNIWHRFRLGFKQLFLSFTSCISWLFGIDFSHI